MCLAPHPRWSFIKREFNDSTDHSTRQLSVTEADLGPFRAAKPSRRPEKRVSGLGWLNEAWGPLRLCSLKPSAASYGGPAVAFGGGGHPHAALLACVAFYVQSRRPAPKGLRPERTESAQLSSDVPEKSLGAQRSPLVETPNRRA